MKLVDANILLYAVNEDAQHHETARAWLDRSLSAGEAVGFAWVVLFAFLRIGTSPAALPSPLEVDEAVSVVEAWLGAPSATVVEPTARHLSVVHGLLAEAGTALNLVTDAHLAALAIEHRAELVSFDHDFARFTGLAWRTPE